MQEAYGSKGKAGKPYDNLDLMAGAVWKKPPVKEGKLENLVVSIVCVFFDVHLIFISVFMSFS